MDHGVPWWSTTNGYGLTWLSVWLMDQGIKLNYSGIGHPETQGKIERFHRTLKRSINREGESKSLERYQDRFDKFRYEYNHVRPHESLQMSRPAESYYRSERRYDGAIKIKEWDYGKDEVLKLNSAGCLEYKGKRYFVCEALANREIGLRSFNGRLLAMYRHMYIREIDLEQRRSYSIVRPIVQDKL